MLLATVCIALLTSKMQILPPDVGPGFLLLSYFNIGISAQSVSSDDLADLKCYGHILGENEYQRTHK